MSITLPNAPLPPIPQITLPAGPVACKTCKKIISVPLMYRGVACKNCEPCLVSKRAKAKLRREAKKLEMPEEEGDENVDPIVMNSVNDMVTQSAPIQAVGPVPPVVPEKIKKPRKPRVKKEKQ